MAPTMAPRHSSLTFDRSRRPCLTREQQSDLCLWSDSGAKPNFRRSLRERFPSKQRSIYLGSDSRTGDLETSVCDGSDSLRKGTRLQDGAQRGRRPKTELEKGLNSARRCGVVTSSSFEELGSFLSSNKWIHGTTCCCVASGSCVEVFVSTVGPLGVCILVSVMATTAPTSAPSMAPTMT